MPHLMCVGRISDHEQAPVRSQLQRLQSRRWPIRRSSTCGFPSEDGSGLGKLSVMFACAYEANSACFAQF